MGPNWRLKAGLPRAPALHLDDVRTGGRAPPFHCETGVNGPEWPLPPYDFIEFANMMFRLCDYIISEFKGVE